MLKAQEIADTLIAAERNRMGIAQFSDDHPDIDVATAYEAQRAFVQVEDRGRRNVCRVQARVDQ